MAGNGMKNFALASFLVIFLGAFALLPRPDLQTTLGSDINQAFQALGFTLPLWGIVVVLGLLVRRISRASKEE